MKVVVIAHLQRPHDGESLERFQKTRNAPTALYSVGGKETQAATWETAQAAHH